MMHKGGMGNIGGLMKQAKMMQEKMASLQEELSHREVSATSGGGMVAVSANGKQEILSIKIEKNAVNPEEVDMLEDLVTAAVNEALRKSKDMVASEMSKVTGGMNIPGLFGG